MIITKKNLAISQTHIMFVLEVYSELKSKGLITEDGLLNVDKMKGTRKLVTFKYWAMIKIINGEWKYGLNAKRIKALEDKFKNKTIEQICEYMNSEVVEKGYDVSNKCIECFEAGVASKPDEVNEIKVKITPIVEFKTKDGDLSGLVDVSGAVKMNEKNK